MNLRAKRELTDVAQFLIGDGNFSDLGRRILAALRIADDPELICPVCGKPVSGPDHSYAEQGAIPVIGCPQVQGDGFVIRGFRP